VGFWGGVLGFFDWVVFFFFVGGVVQVGLRLFSMAPVEFQSWCVSLVITGFQAFLFSDLRRSGGGGPFSRRVFSEAPLSPCACIHPSEAFCGFSVQRLSFQPECRATFFLFLFPEMWNLRCRFFQKLSGFIRRSRRSSQFSFLRVDSFGYAR